MRLAVVDSDSSFVAVLLRRLEDAGWEYRVLPGGAPPEALASMKLNVVLLDPADLRGEVWDYLDRVCNLLPNLGVVVCTGDSSVSDRVRGLRLGADDWITKPCHPEEALARLEAVARRRRRAERPEEKGPLVAGELEIRPDQFDGFVSGRAIELTRREFELLQALAGAEGRVLPREDLYERVWGYAMVHGDRSVDVVIGRLRGKLKRHSPGWDYIHTHFGVGYRFGAELSEGSPTGLDAPDPGGRSGSSRQHSGTLGDTA